MKTSPAGVALIQRFESCKLEAYPDPGVGWKLPTIGWGHTGPDVVRGLRITQPIADRLLQEDLAIAEAAVMAAVQAPLEQHQFDPLVSFAYNCAGWRASTLIRLANAGHFAEAAEQFPRWVHAEDSTGHIVVLPGLVARRAAERAMFSGEAV